MLNVQPNSEFALNDPTFWKKNSLGVVVRIYGGKKSFKNLGCHRAKSLTNTLTLWKQFSELKMALNVYCTFARVTMLLL